MPKAIEDTGMVLYGLVENIRPDVVTLHHFI